MTQFLYLLKIQSKKILRINKKNKLSGLTSVLILAGCFIYIGALYSSMLYDTFPVKEYHYVLFLMFTAGIYFILLTGVSYSQGMLFSFEDFDFLMSLPIKKETILLSKIVSYMLAVYMYVIPLALPCIVIYGLRTKAGFLFYLCSILGYLIEVIPYMLIAALLGLLAKRLTAGKKYGELLRNTVTVLFIFAIWFFSFSLNSHTDIDPNSLSSVIEKMQQFFPLLYSLVEASISGNFIVVSRNILINLVIFTLFVKYISPVILSTNARGKETYHYANFKIRKINSSSPFKALFLKEFKNYFRNFIYVMNSIVGLLLLVFGIIYAFVNSDINQYIPVLVSYIGKEALTDFLIIVCIFVAHTTICTHSMISLEGKRLWLAKSLPVSTLEILLSKIMVNVVIVVIPTALFALIAGIYFNLGLFNIFFIFEFIVLSSLFTGMFGILVNLRFPKFDYDREIVVIKQSLAAFIAVLGSIAIATAVTAMFFIYYDAVDIIAIYFISYIVIDILLFMLLKSWGVKRFNSFE